MAYELSDAFRTGIPSLDEDHRQLLDHVNDIAGAERQGDHQTLVQRLEAFRVHLAEHFTVEEEQLRTLSYPRLEAHARHHAEIIVAIERLIRDVRQGAAATGRIAAACFHELISAVLLRDMQFVNWLADREQSR